MREVHREGSPRVHEAKILVHKALRRAAWALRPDRFPRPRRQRPGPDLEVRVTRRVRLERRDPAADPTLEEGKRINVELAALRIHESWISVDHPFSFWRAVGAIRAADGYRAGLEIHGGCLVPSLGGGICLLSNALFAAAVDAGFDIHERHGHTREAVPDHQSIWGLDATVFHPYVDLRFAPREGSAVLRTFVDADDLVVQILTDHEPDRVELTAVDERWDGDIRENRVLRRRFDPRTGHPVGQEIVATNRREVLHTEQQRQTCRTCGEDACGSRDRFLAVETA